MGRLTSQQDYNAAGTSVVFSRNLYYNAKGQLLNDDASTLNADGYTYRTIARHDYGSGSGYALGSIVATLVDGYRNGSDGDHADTATSYGYAWYDGAVQSGILHDKSYANDAAIGAGMAQGSVLSGFDTDTSTSFAINGFGQLTGATITDGQPRTVTFTHDELGQVIRRDETRPSNAPAVQTGSPHELWYRFAGREMGYTGNNGGAEANNYDAIADRQARPPTAIGTFRGGTTSAVSYTDFVNGYEAATTYDQGSAGGSYTVRGGDTLAGIAASLWGDAGLWYRLAEANGIGANGALVEGQSLALPAGITRSAHNASTFKPYDPGEAIGDLSPTAPKPSKKNKCGVFGQILVAAIAIGLSAWLGPQMIGLFSTTSTATLAGVGGAGLGAISGGTVAVTSISTVGAFAAGAATGAIASAMSQGVGVAIGAQDQFSWKGVGLAALAGGIAGGITGLSQGVNAAGQLTASTTKLGGIGGFLSRGGITSAIARGVATNAATQGIGVATGLQSKFDFAGVAAAAAVSGFGEMASGALPGTATATRAASTGNVVASSAAGAIAGAATRSALNGNSFGDNIMRVLPDVVANSLILAGRSVLAQHGGNDGRGVQLAYNDQSANGDVRYDYVDPRTIVVTAPKQATGMLGLIGGMIEALGGTNPFGALALFDISQRVSMRLTNAVPDRRSMLPGQGLQYEFAAGAANRVWDAAQGLGAQAVRLGNYSPTGLANAGLASLGFDVNPLLPNALPQLRNDLASAQRAARMSADMASRPGYYVALAKQSVVTMGNAAGATLGAAAGGDYDAMRSIARLSGGATVEGLTLFAGGAAVTASARASRLGIAAEGVAADGLVYLRTDTTGRLKPYFGQTTEANQLAREAAHARAFPDSRFKFVTVESGIPKGSALDIAEHNAIQNFTGGVAARRSSAVSNLRDPVGAARRPTFGLPEPK